MLLGGLAGTDALHRRRQLVGRPRTLQPADLNVTFNQYGQRNEEDRRRVDPPIEVESATWSAAGDLDLWVKERQEWLGRCTTPPRIRLIRKWFQDHSRANIGLRTGIAFDVVDLDSEVAVDALEQPGPAGTSYEVLLLLLAADSIGTCCPLASATEPAFSPASTSVAEAATWSALRPFIQVVIVTAGSTHCSKSSLPRPVGSFSSLSQNVVQSGPEPSRRGPEPMA